MLNKKVPGEERSLGCTESSDHGATQAACVGEQAQSQGGERELEKKNNNNKKCMAGSAPLTLTRFEYVDASRFGCYLGQCGFDELVDFAKVGVAHPVAGATADGAIGGKGVDPNLQAGLAWVICSILFQRSITRAMVRRGSDGYYKDRPLAPSR